MDNGSNAQDGAHTWIPEGIKIRAVQQAAVAELGQHALADGDLSPLMSEAVTLIAQVLQVECCKVLELLPDARALILRVGVGWKEGYVGHATVDAGRDSHAGYTLLSNEPVVVEDLHTETRFSIPPLLREHGITSGISVIIGGRRRPFGILGAHTRRQRSFAADDIHFIQSVANVLAQAIERKQREEALREGEKRYRDLIESLRQVLFETDERGNITFVNPFAFELFRYAPQDLEKGLNVFQMLVPGDHDRARRNIQKVLAGEKLDGAEYTALRKDGTSFEIVIYPTPIIRGGEPVGMRGIIFDISDRKRLEQQLYQAQKMEAVGRLAGGIAHDLNNLLTVIIGCGDLLMSGLSHEGPKRGPLEQIMKAAQTAVSLTSQLLAFSRKQILTLQVLDLNAVVLNLEELLRRLIGQDIEVLMRLSPALGKVKADQGQLEQVIMNLAVNARDAMPEGGKLLIETKTLDLDETYGQQHPPVVPGTYTMLAISDTGHGMTPEVQAHLFEPFFTTKERDKGTGLGLSTVYGIVKQSGGYIWVNSEVNRGTTFKIYLPRVDGTTELATTRTESGALSGTETILPVEEDERLQEVLSAEAIARNLSQ